MMSAVVNVVLNVPRYFMITGLTILALVFYSDTIRKMGDRSEKIRTYNFPQNRVSDHRIGLTLHQLDFVMEGKMDAIFDALIAHYQGEKMKQQAEQGPVN